MITSEKLYLLCQKKLNTNIQNQVSIQRGDFVLYYNNAQLTYYDTLINSQRSTDVIQRINRFLIPADLERTTGNIHNAISFKLPEDFVKREEIIVMGQKGHCDPDLLSAEEIKPAEISIHYNNSTTKPSFEFRETFYYVGNDSINVFTDGTFDIPQLTLIYYRRPRNIDLAGYINELNEPSSTINPEMSDEDINQVLDLTVQAIAIGNLPTRDISN